MWLRTPGSTSLLRPRIASEPEVEIVSRRGNPEAKDQVQHPFAVVRVGRNCCIEHDADRDLENEKREKPTPDFGKVGARFKPEKNYATDYESLSDHGKSNVDDRIALIPIVGFHETGQHEVQYPVPNHCDL